MGFPSDFRVFYDTMRGKLRGLFSSSTTFSITVVTQKIGFRSRRNGNGKIGGRGAWCGAGGTFSSATLGTARFGENT